MNRLSPTFSEVRLLVKADLICWLRSVYGGKWRPRLESWGLCKIMVHRFIFFDPRGCAQDEVEKVCRAHGFRSRYDPSIGPEDRFPAHVFAVAEQARNDVEKTHSAMGKSRGESPFCPEHVEKLLEKWQGFEDAVPVSRIDDPRK